jgi:hypothetical protein
MAEAVASFAAVSNFVQLVSFSGDVLAVVMDISPRFRMLLMSYEQFYLR